MARKILRDDTKYPELTPKDIVNDLKSPGLKVSRKTYVFIENSHELDAQGKLPSLMLKI